MPTAAPSSVTVSSTGSNTRRLHITPLTNDILPKVLGSHLALAQEVSFHKLPNFPNRDYGFVTLPISEAAMVKKRIHGTILRGEKVAVEDARADTKLEKVASERQQTAEANSTTELLARPLRKRRREEGVITEAIELPQGRQVKRGWTEAKADMESRRIKEKKDGKSSKEDKKKKEKKSSKSKASTFTDKEECLFQTAISDKATENGKGQPVDREHKKGRKGKNVVVVHEFENTTKYPTYLRYTADKSKKAVQGYDEEKGWIDANGNVVEVAPESKEQRKSRRLAKKNDQQATEPVSTKQDFDDDDETSSSGSSSDSEVSNDNDEERGEKNAKVDLDDGGATRPTEPTLSITPSSPVTPHPLETLFKKPKPPSGQSSAKSGLEIDTSFSFFDADEEDQSTSQSQIAKSLETPGLPALRRRGLPSLSIPVTPYNPRDMQFRSQRSAAPTPDTAAPGKSGFGDPFGLLAGIHKERQGAIEEEDEQEEENDEDVMQGVEEEEDRASGTPPVQSDGKADGKESEFAKWFWENRGANTRAWKKRKREAVKEQRSRETRKRKT